MYEKHDQLVILGAGGHAKVCYEIAKKMKVWKSFVILDDNPVNSFFEIMNPISEWNIYINSSDYFVAIGSNQVRMTLVNKLLNNKANVISLIDRDSVLSETVSIGKGTVVMPGVTINSSTKVGNGVIINTNTSVDHDGIIGDGVHISPGVTISGTVEIGENTWIGAGSTIINNLRITNNVIVGAGATVTKDLPANCTAVGTPAKPIKYHAM